MMGVVYEALDPLLERSVALKTINPSLAAASADPGAFERRFLAEARIAARLSHPGIVVVHDSGREAETGTLFMALELLKGEGLDTVIRRRAPLPWREALGIARRVAEALAHAHREGVVHRDIKPSNVMVLPDGEPKIMDFGIAKVEAAHLTATGQFLGTPLYMSPEQASGAPLDGRSDVFSLGAIVYEMLTGRRAFDGKGVTQIIMKVVDRNPPPPSAVVSGLPPGADYVTLRALAKKPDDRYAGAREMAEDIADVLADRVPRHRGEWSLPLAAADATMTALPAAARSFSGTLELTGGLEEVLEEPRAPMPAPPAGLSPKPAPTRSRRGWAVAALTAAVAFLVGGGAVMLWRGPAAPEPSPMAARLRPPPSTRPARLETIPSTVRPRLPDPPLASGPARLVVDFKHPLRSGTLRVWVDDDLRIEESLAGNLVADLGRVKIHSGQLEQALELRSGRHEIRVRVEWDGKAKVSSIRGNFTPGSARRLEIQLSLISKDLSLEWR